MSTLTERPTRTVAATVMSKAETTDGFKLELQIPEFKGQFPTIVTRVPKELAASLQAGMVYNLVLERQNVSKRKDGTPYDGSKPWMFYWGLKGVASSRDSMPETLPDEPETREPMTRDATRDSIERQKALDIAERFYSRFVSDPDLTVAEHSSRLLLLAGKLAQWLATGKAPVSPVVGKSPSQGPETAPGP